MKKIILTGGGTAGHIYPALAIAERLKDYEIHYIGGSGMERDIVKKEKNIFFHEIPTVKLERKLTLKNLLIPFKLFRAVHEAKKIIKDIQPNVIFSKGGFVSVPVVLAGKGIPIISHESDLSMGLANKIILTKCNYMCTAFLQTSKGNKKCIYTGQPIRKKVFQGNRCNIVNAGSFTNSLPNLLVVGGSTGAKFINEKIWENLATLTKKFNIVHITGKQNNENHTSANYLQVDYADNIGDYYAFADIILSRAGSGAINEFLALKKPMLLIPLSKKCSRGDQIENAKLFTSLKIADMLEEEDCTNEQLIKKLENILKNSQNFKKNMGKIQSFDACDKIIELIEKVELKK